MSVRRALGVVTAAACLLSFAAAPLQAASLESIQGEVLIDRGGGFAIVPGPTSLDPGDTVIANPGSGALIVYDAECKISVKPGDVVTVHKSAPCGGGGGESIFDTTTLLVGAGVIGLGAGAAVLLTSGGSDKPASP
jgi:hypothetical protein